jgi:hypothetical protein
VPKVTEGYLARHAAMVAPASEGAILKWKRPEPLGTFSGCDQESFQSSW